MSRIRRFILAEKRGDVLLPDLVEGLERVKLESLECLLALHLLELLERVLANVLALPGLLSHLLPKGQLIINMRSCC